MAPPKRKVYVIGVGMTKFEKPGRRPDFDYPQMGEEAATKALKDAGIDYKEVEQAVVGYCYGDTTCGQRILYQVNNACSTSSTALFMAEQLVKGGLADCCLALGFEKMERGSLKAKWTDHSRPMEKHSALMYELRGGAEAPGPPQSFENAGKEHMEKYGTKPIHFAEIGWKNHKHSVNNPYSQFQTEYTLEQVVNSRTVYDYLTLLQCCPTSDGSGCAIIASEDFVRKHGLEHQAVEIIGQTMTTDLPSTFEDRSCMKIVGYDMTKLGAEKIYQQTGYKCSDVDVIELHDCFSANELITYEALGLCPEGGAGDFIDRGDNTYGGRYVINPSGGLISKGHPLGATGLAQCSEADKRQVKGAKLALQHNLGLGGAVVLTMYKLGFPEARHRWLAGQKKTSTPSSFFNTSAAAGFKSAAAFVEIKNQIDKDGTDITKKMGGIITFKVRGPGGKEITWTIDAKSGDASLELNSGKKAECTLSIKDEDLVDLMTGKLNPNTAFFSGKLKISGNMGLAMKIDSIMPAKPKM